MLTSILAGIGFIALSILISYNLSAFFWKTDYSKTNKTGDFGSPRGGVFAIMAGIPISIIIVSSLGKYVIDANAFGYVLVACMICSGIAGMIPLFRNRPLK